MEISLLERLEDHMAAHERMLIVCPFHGED
jgi:hypothetical protein